MCIIDEHGDALGLGDNSNLQITTQESLMYSILREGRGWGGGSDRCEWLGKNKRAC